MVMPDSGPPDLAGQVAIVTGAAGDVGRAAVRALAGCAAAVVGADIHDSSSAFAEDGSISCRRLDVTSRADAESLVAGVMSEHGRIDIAVLAAGIATLTRVDTVTDEEWDRVMGVNAYGVMNVARSVVPVMKERRYGKIVAVGSIAGRLGGAATGAAYAASKGAVHALIKNIARNGTGDGIYANAVAPGPVTGKMWGDVVNDGSPPDPSTIVPLGRYGMPGDIAQAIVFLASPQSNWVTGQVLDVNGGMMMI